LLNIENLKVCLGTEDIFPGGIVCIAFFKVSPHIKSSVKGHESLNILMHFFADSLHLISDMRRKVHINGSFEIGQVVKTSDEGIYTCEASNRHGQTSKGSTQIQVMGKAFHVK
jgi:hypothetical protein